MKKKSEQREINTSLILIVKSSLFVFFGVLFSKLFTYVYRVIIARYFGPETYGLFSLSMVVLFFLLSFFALGLQEGLLRFVPLYSGKKETQKIRYIFKFAVTIIIFSSILAGVLLYSFSGAISTFIFHEPDLAIFLKILSFIIPFFMIAYAFLAVVNGFEKIKVHSFISDFLLNLLKVVSIIILIFIGIKTNAVMLSYLIAVVIIFLIVYFYCKSKIPEIFGKVNLKTKTKKQIRKELLKYSWPLIFSGILSGILGYIDSFVLGIYKGAAEVGFYNAAVPLAVLMVFVPGLFIRLFFPLITKEFSRKNFKVIKELSKQVVKWILIVNLPIFLLMILFPGAFINLFFGSEYLVAENALRFLVIGFMFFSMSMILNNLISMAGKTRIILINILFISVLNLILNLILIPMPLIFGLDNSSGILGAALATTISYIVLSLIYFIQVKHYTSIIPLRRKMIRVLISVAIPTVLLIYFKKFIPINLFTIIVQGSFFILFYLFLIIITKSLDKNDRMVLETMKNKIKSKIS